jgi:hypothetical protein
VPEGSPSAGGGTGAPGLARRLRLPNRAWLSGGLSSGHTRPGEGTSPRARRRFSSAHSSSVPRRPEAVRAPESVRRSGAGSAYAMAPLPRRMVRAEAPRDQRGLHVQGDCMVVLTGVVPVTHVEGLVMSRQTLQASPRRWPTISVFAGFGPAGKPAETTGEKRPRKALRENEQRLQAAGVHAKGPPPGVSRPGTKLADG